mgnify:FL=1
MLAEIAIANAAFGVIKEAISNGKEIYDVGAQVGQFFDSKTELQKKANKNGYRSDLQAFMELEKVKEMEDHLKDQMIYAGRPGMWEEWLNFQKEAKEARELAAREKLRKKRETLELLLYSFYGLCGFLIVVPLVFLILAALK